MTNEKFFFSFYLFNLNRIIKMRKNNGTNWQERKDYFPSFSRKLCGNVRLSCKQTNHTIFRSILLRLSKQIYKALDGFIEKYWTFDVLDEMYLSVNIFEIIDWLALQKAWKTKNSIWSSRRYMSNIRDFVCVSNHCFLWQNFQFFIIWEIVYCVIKCLF